jgi:hypothetical protein
MPLKSFKKIKHEMILDVFKVTTQTIACKIMWNTRLKRSITNLHNFQNKKRDFDSDDNIRFNEAID